MLIEAGRSDTNGQKNHSVFLVPNAKGVAFATATDR
jgi:hypothetical protein